METRERKPGSSRSPLRWRSPDHTVARQLRLSYGWAADLSQDGLGTSPPTTAGPHGHRHAQDGPRDHAPPEKDRAESLGVGVKELAEHLVRSDGYELWIAADFNAAQASLKAQDRGEARPREVVVCWTSLSDVLGWPPQRASVGGTWGRAGRRRLRGSVPRLRRSAPSGVRRPQAGDRGD